MPVIACMGLTFKADIDDLRESPAVYIADKLSKDMKVVVVEPNISNHAYFDLAGSDRAVDMRVYLVDHKEFKSRVLECYDLDFTK